MVIHARTARGGRAMRPPAVPSYGSAARFLLAAGAGVALLLMWAAALTVRGLHGAPGVRLDADWASTIASMRGPAAVGAAGVFAWLGGGVGSILVGATFGLLLWWRRGLRTALRFVALALVSVANVHLIKAVALRPRPTGELWGGIGSFPSGHTAYAAVVAVTAGALFARAIVWIGGLVLVAAMAISRTVIDAHWLTDTVAGAACGTAMAVLVWALALHPEPMRSPT